MDFHRFNYTKLEDVIKDAESNNLKIHFSKDLGVLRKPVRINNLTIPNSLAVNPMEGCDGELDGSPGELTKRRYERFAKGGAGLIWFEAVAVVHEGRANPRQLFITENNVSDFQRIYESIMSNAAAEYGYSFKPVCIMQLTHSGRFSRPDGVPKPVIACHNPIMSSKGVNDESLTVITDDELERLEEQFENAAVLAKKAGFQGVDIKACHRYLNSELLSAYTRKGRYGETFEGRTRFMRNVTDRIRSRLGDGFIITTRINIYDGIEHPYGWGTDKNDFRKYDLAEPAELIKILREKGVRLINITMGTPYFNPHVNRPYDIGGYVPQEHPMAGVARMINGAAEIQKAFADIAVVGTGYSWLRQFSPYLAAGTLENNWATLIGFGRESFAYPDFARDIFASSEMKKEKCCITCGKCTEIMRAGGTTGCVIKDTGVYGPIYKEYCMK